MITGPTTNVDAVVMMAISAAIGRWRIDTPGATFKTFSVIWRGVLIAGRKIR
jgi:hypothetical protein